MRHGKKFNHLSRQTGHRKAMLANMACSLIEHKRINTTVAKAKALKQFVEPLITKSKQDTTHNRRIVFANLRSKYAVTDLFRDVAAKVGDRPGGYTRIIKVGNRLGDNADMAMIELVDFNELYNGPHNRLLPSVLFPKPCVCCRSSPDRPIRALHRPSATFHRTHVSVLQWQCRYSG